MISDFQINERYKRNTEVIGFEGQKKLSSARILVAGAGGLGSGVIAGLTSVGVGTLGIIDSDVVEVSNLNRQFIHTETSVGRAKVESSQAWVRKYSPHTKVKTYKLRISCYSEQSEESPRLKECNGGDSSVDSLPQNDNSFFQNYDLVIDCFDSYRSKFALNKICVQKCLPLIHGGVGEFSGQVFTILPGKTACLNCLLPETNQDSPKGILSPTVNLIASIQTMEAIKLILNLEELLTDTLLTYDGRGQEFRKFCLRRKADCLTCGQ
jgi:molybdopterin/thiamine biosynthesis adenylyltransferase